MSAAENLRSNMRKLMDAHQLGQAELAKRAGISHRSVTHMLSDAVPGHAPNLETIELVAAALQVKVDYLLGSSDTNLEATLGAVPALVSRQVGRLVEDFLATSPEGRRIVLACASDQAEKTARRSDTK